METKILANVMLWGKRLGVVRNATGKVEFQYDPQWVGSGVGVSPILMPLSNNIYSFPELNRVDVFQGLPGFLSDALPDQFGNKIINQHLASQGRLLTDLTAVEKLLYMGNRSMGALEFEPAINQSKHKDVNQILEVRSLMEQSRLLLSGDSLYVLQNTLNELLRVGGSAGGARPKAVVLWNKKNNKMKSGFATANKEDESWLIKFDGTGTLENPDKSPKPYNKIEFTYSELAKMAGIEMTETKLFLDGDFAHFMTKRFDRDGARKNHIHSLGGLLHMDFNQPGLVGYEQFFETCRRLKLAQVEIDQAYRRMLFNIVGVNQDDHVKNISFMRREGGDWGLSPAYDISFVKGHGWTKNHQMSVFGELDGDKITRKSLVDLGNIYDVRKPEKIVDEVVDVFSHWPSLAIQNEVPKKYVDAVSSQLRLNLSMWKMDLVNPNRNNRLS